MEAERETVPPFPYKMNKKREEITECFIGSRKTQKNDKKAKKLSKNPLTKEKVCGIIYKLSGRKAQEM